MISLLFALILAQEEKASLDDLLKYLEQATKQNEQDYEADEVERGENNVRCRKYKSGFVVCERDEA